MKKISRGGVVTLAGLFLLSFAFIQAGEKGQNAKTSRTRLFDEAFQKDQGKSTAGKAAKQVKKIDAKKSAKTPFMRIKRNAKGDPLSMQTSVVRYVPAKGKNKLVVDLVGVVHIAESKYYSRLNDLFEDYDVVLYELVAPKGAVPRPGKGGNNPLAFVQKAMTMVLNLDHQLNRIDYTPTNFVHADMSPKEMAAAMKKRGDTPITLALSMMADLLREQNLREMRAKKAGKKLKTPSLDPFKLLTDPNAATKLKIMMAESMVQMGDGSALGKTLDTLLVKDRNAACMKVFQKQVVAGKKKIAIFYGAAHMPDFEQRLIRDYGMRREGIRWFDAWNLRAGGNSLLNLLKRLR